jgi:hypothetical protein
LKHFLDSAEGGSHREHIELSPKPQQATDQNSHPSLAAGAGADNWRFRLGTRNSFLMKAIAIGGKSRAEIREEFDRAFSDSAGKSTFDVFFTYLRRPFGSAGVSRCLPVPKGGRAAIHIDPKLAQTIQDAIAAGMLKEITCLEPRGTFPKRLRRDVDAIVRKYGAPLDPNHSHRTSCNAVRTKPAFLSLRTV